MKRIAILTASMLLSLAATAQTTPPTLNFQTGGGAEDVCTSVGSCNPGSVSTESLPVLPWLSAQATQHVIPGLGLGGYYAGARAEIPLPKLNTLIPANTFDPYVAAGAGLLTSTSTSSMFSFFAAVGTDVDLTSSGHFVFGPRFDVLKIGPGKYALGLGGGIKYIFTGGAAPTAAAVKRAAAKAKKRAKLDGVYTVLDGSTSSAALIQR